PLEPVANGRRELARRKQPGLLREIRVDVGLHQQRSDLLRVRTGATVKEHERRLSQRRVVENGLEEQRIGAAQLEVAAAPVAGMYMNRQAESAGFDGDVVEDDVLNRHVLGLVRNVRACLLRIGAIGGGLVAARKVEWPQIRDLVLDRDSSLAL